MPHYRVRTNERGLSGGGPGVRRALSTADGPVGRNCGNKEGVGVSSHLYPYYVNNEITTKIPNPSLHLLKYLWLLYRYCQKKVRSD